MTVTIFDIETDGIEATKIHCVSATTPKGIKSTSKYANMASFLSKQEVLVGHNIIRYDIPTVKRILGVDLEAKLVDTLALSWYLYPNRVLHGLEAWGEDLGFPKPKIDDWENLTTEEYIHRCESDVEINQRLWDRMWNHLNLIYDSEEEVWRFIDYVTFKMQCAQRQEELKWKLDIDKVNKLHEHLLAEKEPKHQHLLDAMPKVPKKEIKTKPKKPFKKDGTPSAVGEKWFSLLKEKKLPETYNGGVEVVKEWKEPNPNSHTQLKDWLFSLGWEPKTFDFKRNKETNETRKIPQIKNQEGDDLCESVIALMHKEPAVEALRGLSIINHRLTITEGFLSTVDEEGYVKAQIQGLTNTLRFQHKKPIVNLPGVDKPYGEDIRGCLVAPEGYTLCGSDQAALEDRTKQHYMWDYDPEYVKVMMEDGYCPHIDIAVLAGYLSKGQQKRYATDSFESYEDEKEIKAGRKKAKPVNYGGVYGQTPNGLSMSANMPLEQAEKLHKIYWERNWSVKAIAEDCIVKTVKGQMWLFNPVSKFWYSLRYEKDRFSTLNQGTGVYCFDTWVKHCADNGEEILAQMHDEIVCLTKIGEESKSENNLKDALEKTNAELNLNRRLDIDVQFGASYAEIH